MPFVVDGAIGSITGDFTGQVSYPSNFVSGPPVHAALPVSSASTISYAPPLTGLREGDLVVVQWSSAWAGSTSWRTITTPAFTNFVGSLTANRVRGFIQYKRLTAADAALANWTLTKAGTGTFVQAGNWLVIRDVPSVSLASGAYSGSGAVTSATPTGGGVNSVAGPYLRVNLLWLLESVANEGYVSSSYTTLPEGSYLAGHGKVDDGSGPDGQIYSAMSVGDVSSDQPASWHGWTFPSNRALATGIAFLVDEAALISYQPEDILADSFVLEPGAEDTRISLTSPTQLTFSTITWKVRFFHTYEGANMYGLDGFAIQPDDAIGQEGGYQTGAFPWYTRAYEGGSEGFEVHGSVGDAWWQIILIGQGQAILTNGQGSVTVDVVAGEWYTVTMGVSGATSTLIMRDSDDVPLNGSVAMLGLYDAPIVLDESIVGASGTRFVPGESGRSEEADDVNVGEPDAYGQQHEWYGGLMYPGFWSGIGVDSKTGGVGTTASMVADPWTMIPYFSSCGGLDFTFWSAKHVETWWLLTTVDFDAIPEWATFLRVKINVQNWMGAEGMPIDLHYKNEPPVEMWDGARAGEAAVIGVATIDAHVPVSAFNPDGTIYIGLMTRYKAWVGIVECGTAFEDPYLTGEWGSHRIYFSEPYDLSWTATIVEEALRVDFDFIGLDGMTTGDAIVYDEGEQEVQAGWNTEIVPVVGGIFTIQATPAPGSVNVYSIEGGLLTYGSDWEEVDDFGLDYRLLTSLPPLGGQFVTVTYFVTEPTPADSLPVSRPDQDFLEVNRPISHVTGY